MQSLINININRATTNINFDLPFVLFNVVDFPSGYAQSLKGLIPSGVQFLNATNEVGTGNIKFIYRDIITTQIDNIIVSCNEIPFLTLIHNSYNNKIKIKSLLYSIEDVALSYYQFSQKIQFINIAMPQKFYKKFL